MQSRDRPSQTEHRSRLAGREGFEPSRAPYGIPTGLANLGTQPLCDLPEVVTRQSLFVRVLASINFMSDDRILAIDIGAGTMDVLLYDPAQPMENAVQLVLPCATAIAGKKIAAARETGRRRRFTYRDGGFS